MSGTCKAKHHNQTQYTKVFSNSMYTYLVLCQAIKFIRVVDLSICSVSGLNKLEIGLDLTSLLVFEEVVK